MFEEFFKYVSNFDMNDEKIRLKYEHSKQVYAISVEIAKSINLSQESIELAGLIGLLHDIGRFIQWEKYKTFRDHKSLHHGELGVHILFEDGLIRNFIEDSKYDNLIKAAILYHNDFKLPNNLDKTTLIFCRIIRDADKIDILDNETKIKDKKYMRRNKVSDKVLNEFINSKCIDFKDIVYGYDSEILRISLLYDMNFRYTFEIVKEKGFIDKLLNRMNDDPNIEVVRNKIISYLDEQIRKPKEWSYVRKTI